MRHDEEVVQARRDASAMMLRWMLQQLRRRQVVV
jgi:hypothetical protein